MDHFMQGGGTPVKRKQVSCFSFIVTGQDSGLVQGHRPEVKGVEIGYD